jgi:hypothetical protein
MRLSRTFALAAFSLLAVACADPLAGTRDRLGLITTRAYNNGGTPVLRGTGTFYTVNGLSLPILQATSCTQFSYNPLATGSGVPTLDAGDFITFSVQGLATSAERVQIGSFIRYEMLTGTFVSFASGDTVTVSATGAPGGFVPTSAKTRIAEAFTADTIPTWVDGQPLNLTWSPAVAPGSFMIVSMRYASNVDLPAPDVEISCIFDDDGTGSIPATMAQIWANSEPGTRSYLFTRAREGTVTVDSRTKTRIRSFYDVPTPVLTVPAP